MKTFVLHYHVCVSACLGLENRMHWKNKGGLHSSALYIQGEDKILEIDNNIIKDLINTSRIALILLGMRSWMRSWKSGILGYCLKRKSSISLKDEGGGYLIHSLCFRTSHKWSMMFISSDWGGDGRHFILVFIEPPLKHFSSTYRSIFMLEYWRIIRKECWTWSYEHAKHKSMDLMIWGGSPCHYGSSNILNSWY